MNIKIITDNACDLTKQEIEEFDIEIMHIALISSKADEVDKNIEVEEIFKRQGQGESFKTSQIPEFEYLECFEKYAKEDIPFIYLSLSSGLTGGYANSCMALKNIKEKYPNIKASVIDTGSASVGFGLFTYLMAKANKKGKTFDELLEFADFLQENISHIFTVFDLKYLYQGGRIIKVGKNITKMLNIMPIITFSNKKLKIAEIVRGKKKTIKSMVNTMERDMKRPFKDEIIMPVYGQDMEIIGNFEELLKEAGANKIIPHQMGTVIASHVGPDIIGASYLKEEIPEKFKDIL